MPKNDETLSSLEVPARLRDDVKMIVETEYQANGELYDMAKARRWLLRKGITVWRRTRAKIFKEAA